MSEIKQPKIRFKGYINDWEQRKIGEVGKISTGNTPKTSVLDNYAEEGLLWITPTDIKSLVTKDSAKKLSILGQKKARIASKGSILVTCIASIGKNTLILNDSAFNQQINALTPNVDFDSYFLLTQSEMWSRVMSNIASSGTMPIINKSEFSKLEFKYPKLEEQSKIGEFFKTLDETITLHQQKLEVTKQFKQTMLKKMFPKNGETKPEIRFKGFNDDWEHRKLGDLIIKNSLRNKDLKVSNVESISNKTGFTKQTEQFNDYSVASSDLSNYYVISENNFAYNPSRINVGSIGYKKCGEPISVISPLYISFYTNNDLNDLFLWYWFKTDYFNRQRQLFSEGGVRDTLSFNKLVDMKITIPKNEEQEVIGNYFKELDIQINALKQKLETYKEFKKAMLQKMFV